MFWIVVNRAPRMAAVRSRAHVGTHFLGACRCGAKGFGCSAVPLRICFEAVEAAQENGPLG